MKNHPVRLPDRNKVDSVRLRISTPMKNHFQLWVFLNFDRFLK